MSRYEHPATAQLRAALPKVAHKHIEAVLDTLDGAGWLIPEGDIRITLEPDRAVTRATTMAGGIELEWCGDVLVSLVVPYGSGVGEA